MAVTQVCAEYRALSPVYWGTLHTDPSPDAFRFDSTTGTVGLIDWTGSETGPLLYDIASAVMYLGGPERSQTFLAGYLDTGAVPPAELDHLDAFRRLRWVVQAVYFAHRLAMDDRTGITDAAENHQGSDDARRALTTLGVLH
jgi:Ser/Thr protein kinase RdoA (MazF antagonist)